VIVRADLNPALFITQPDHAALAATIMRGWDSGGLPESPRHVAIMLAIQAHDNGWQEADAEPCLDPANGQDLFSERLDAPGQYAASPVAADGRIYAASENGVITVLEASDNLRILAKNDLGGKIFATPALHERRLYVRTTTHLYAFGE